MGLDFGKVRTRFHEHAMDALMEGAQVVLDRSSELVPVQGEPDTDGGVTLAESGHVSKVSEGRPLVAAVSYEGPYAIYQHEGFEFKHPTGGQAKYLETALNESTGTATEKIGDALRRGVGL